MIRERTRCPRRSFARGKGGGVHLRVQHARIRACSPRSRRVCFPRRKQGCLSRNRPWTRAARKALEIIQFVPMERLAPDTRCNVTDAEFRGYRGKPRSKRRSRIRIELTRWPVDQLRIRFFIFFFTQESFLYTFYIIESCLDMYYNQVSFFFLGKIWKFSKISFVSRKTREFYRDSGNFFSFKFSLIIFPSYSYLCLNCIIDMYLFLFIYSVY